MRPREVYIKIYRHIIQSPRDFSEHLLMNTMIVFRLIEGHLAAFQDFVLPAVARRPSPIVRKAQ